MASERDAVAGEAAEGRLLELYRLVLENVRDLITLFDQEGRILYASPSHLQTLGYEPAELTGRTLEGLVHPDDLDELLAERRSALETSRGSLESLRIRHADGSWVTLEGTASAARDEHGRGLLLTTARDVGAQRETEAALRESRDLLEAVLGAVDDGITVLSAEGRFVYANRRALELIGAGSVEELGDRPADEITSDFELRSADGAPLPVDRLPGRRVLLGEPAAEEEVVYVTPRGEQRTSIVRALPVRSPDGTPRLAITVFRNVTAERRAALRLRVLAEASALLGSSLAYETTLRSLAELVVPGIADWYAADLLDGDELRRIAVGHADPSQAALGWQLSKTFVRWEAERLALERGEPVLVERVDEETLQAAYGHDEQALAGARALGLRSRLFVPLVSRGRALGTISLAMAESGRSFDAEDVALAGELAARAATAVDNARLYRQTREAAALLDLLFGSAPVGFAFLDFELRFVRVNEALAELNGLPVAEHLGRSLLELLPDLGDDVFRAYDRALREGEATLGLEISLATQAHDGERRAFRVSIYPVRDPAGEVLGAGVIVTDETERGRLLEREQAARAEAEAAAQTFRGLEGVSRAGLSHLSPDELMSELLSHIVDLLGGDTAGIMLLDGAGETLELRASVGLDDERRAAQRIPYGAGLSGGVVASGEPALVDDLTEIELASPVLPELGVRSIVIVPLLAEGRPFGVLHVASLEQAHFRREDLRMLALVADRVSLAIGQSRLYEAERDARRTAQEAQERLAFLAEASDVLGSSLDYGATLASLARLVVPRLADWCAIDVLAGEETVERVAVAHVDPAKVALAEELHRRYPPSPEDTTGAYGVLRTGEPVLAPEIADEQLAAALADRPEYLAALRELGLRSVMLVPLVARGRTLGVMSLIWAESDRRYGPGDLLFAQELARRAAISVDNALLFREAEERGQAARILQSVGDGVFLVDGGGILRYWNRAAEEITGLRAGAVVDRPVVEALPGWAAIAPLVAIGGPPQSMPLQLATRELWLSLSGVALEEGTVYAFRDLTEERALEELRTEFVSTVSHELRTPLAAIYGAAMTLRRDDVQLEEGQREGLLGVVTGEADRLARIVNDILWASRLDSGSLHVAIESCDGAALAATVVEAQRAHLPAGVELALEAAPGLPPVAADPDKVRQVLVNLVDNAVKYSPDGGRVRVLLQARGSQVRFSVSDEGLGIPYAEQRRIFDKFYRLDPNLTRGVGGTGLGLYICRELVRRMHGRIWVESRPEQGSTFSIELPVADGGDEEHAHLASY